MPPRPSRRRPAPSSSPSVSAESSVLERVMDVGESSVLDVLDHVLAKGVMATGDLTLGVAGVDLIYVRLSALLCAADRVLPPAPPTAPEGQPRRRRAGRRR